MDVECIVRLLEAAVPLVQALSWPVIVLFILIAFGGPLKKFLEGLEQFTFKAGLSGLEASARRQQIEAAALLGAAAASKAEKSPSGDALTESSRAQEIASIVSQAVRPEVIPAVAQASILWVDENPSNSSLERRALEAVGVRFTLCQSTEEALEQLRIRGYDAIISDGVLSAEGEPDYTLLKGMHRQGDATPLIIYSRSGMRHNRAEARRMGAFGTTTRPEELFAIALGALTRGARR